MAAMPTAFITGANRGIGLEFVKQLAARGDRVYAACRTPAKADELSKLDGDIEIVACDVVDPKSVKAAAKAVEGSIDLLVNNAGVSGPKYEVPSDTPFDVETVTGVYRANVIGPMLVTQALAGKMANPSKAATISSGYGSIAQADENWPAFYCSSKAAANMTAKILGKQLAPRGVTYISLSPGWVKTDMGGQNATQTPEESISKMLALFDKLTPEDAGKFYDRGGDELPY